MSKTITAATEATITRLLRRGLSRTEAICLLDDAAAAEGGIEYEVEGCTLAIDADGNLTELEG